MLKSRLMILAMLLPIWAGCSKERDKNDSEYWERRREEIELRQRSVDDGLASYENRPLSCDLFDAPYRGSGPRLFSSGHIDSIESVTPLEQAVNPVLGTRHQQFDIRDKGKLAIFYRDYERITRSAEKAADNKDSKQLAADFNQALDLLERWGKSGLKQQYCTYCGSIRINISEISVSIALRKFSIDSSESEFQSHIRQFLEVERKVENISAPKNPDPTDDRSRRHKFYDDHGDDFMRFDMHYALMLYYMMQGDERSAGEEWKKMIIGYLAVRGPLEPMADDEYVLIDDLSDASNSPFDIVRVRRIDTSKHDVCSSLYRYYLEYLIMLGTYDPRFVDDKQRLAARARQFEKATDPRLISPPMRQMLDKLLEPEQHKR